MRNWISTAGPGCITCVAMLGFVLVAGCQSESADWSKAKQAGTIASYEKYLSRYPDGPNATEASQALADLRRGEDWQKACSANTAESYLAFAAGYPGSPESAAIESKLRPLVDPADPDLRKYEVAKEARLYTTMKKAVEEIHTPPVKFLAERELGRFQRLEAVRDTFITIDDLKTKYNWNGRQVFWKPDPSAMAALTMSNGSWFVLSAEVDSPEHGMPFDFGFAGTMGGQFGVGNLIIQGDCTSTETGLTLLKGAVLHYYK